MNVFAIIILAALVLRFVLELVADILNLRALKLELPSALVGIYQSEDYRKSQQYLRVKTRFGFVGGTFSLSIILAFWFVGGFNYLDQVIRGCDFIPLVSGLLYIGIILLASELLMLPFSIYGTFVIEERFGFNRTTPKTFILDRAKGMSLAILIGTPILAGILALFEFAGSYAWLYCWAVIIIYSVIMRYIAPTWIMPIFNKFTPMESGELKEAIMDYARSVDFSVKNVMVMDGSRRSSKSNAFFTGFGRNKRIALFDTLIEKHSVAELVAVLAHEIGHYKKKHILQGIVVSILHTGVILFLLSLLLDSSGLYDAFYMTDSSIYAGLIFFSLLYTPIEMVLSLVMRLISRRNEYEADRFAAETVDEPASIIDALKRLHTDNLSNLTPHPFYVFLNYSHPTLLQRIQTIQGVITQNSST